MGALAAWPTWFPRVLVAGTIGWTVALFAVMPAMVLMPWRPAVGLCQLAVVSPARNMVTAPLLPILVAGRCPLGLTLRSAIGIGVLRGRRWWFPVLLQMLLLGWLTVISVTITDNPAPGEFSTSSRQSFHVNSVWTGGYENDCRWLEDLMHGVDAAPLPVVEFLLGLMFTVLASVVKLRGTASLDDPAGAPPAENGPADVQSGLDEPAPVVGPGDASPTNR